MHCYIPYSLVPSLCPSCFRMHDEFEKAVCMHGNEAIYSCMFRSIGTSTYTMHDIVFIIEFVQNYKSSYWWIKLPV